MWLSQASQVLDQLCIVWCRSHRLRLRIFGWCCRTLNSAVTTCKWRTLCLPLSVFDVLGYSCLLQSFCRWNCHTFLHQDSSSIEIEMPLPPHLETVTRNSARQKHCAQRQCPSLQTARWLIPRGHTRVSQASTRQSFPAPKSADSPQLQFVLGSNCFSPQNLCVSW